MPLRPRPLPTIAAIVVAATCLRLMVWQLARYAESEATTAAVAAQWEAEPVNQVPLDAPQALVHRRATLTGTWTERAPTLVKGGLISGVPGYQWLEVLQQPNGARVLVDRGWVPVDITHADLLRLRERDVVSIEGILVPLSGPASLRASPGPDGLAKWPMHTDLLWGLLPRVLGQPLAAVAAAETEPVAPLALRVGPHLEDERLRKHGPLPIGGYMLPIPRTHNLSYAAQWLAFALMALVLWVWQSWQADPGAPR